MAQVRICDRCSEPFPTNVPGWQTVHTVTLRRKDDGRLFNTEEDFDLCQKDAFGQEPPKPPTAMLEATTEVQDNANQETKAA